jgi:predicted acyl esterase
MVAYGDPLTDIKVWKKKSPYFIKAGSPEAKKYPGFNPRSVETPEGLLIEYDVAVTMRDGVKMYIDIYRPANQPSSTKIPIVIAWTPVPFYLCFTDCSMVNIIQRQLRHFHSIRVSMLRD